MAPRQEPGTFLEWQGRTLKGRYHIEALLRYDSLAALYQATDPYRQHTLTIHLFNPDLTSAPQFQVAFTRWATAVAQLHHPYIAPVIDFGQEGDIYYLVSEVQSGTTLADWLEQQQAEKHRPNRATLVRVAASIGEALAYAHGQGVIHRQLHPGNIIIDEGGNPLLASFGLPSIIADAELTPAGASLDDANLVAYISPEQVRGDTADGRSDLYALGVILYEMVAGERPFQADTPLQVALMRVTQPAPDLRRLRPEALPAMAQVIEQALATDPDQRYQTATELLAALDEAVGPISKGYPFAAGAQPEAPPGPPLEAAAPDTDGQLEEQDTAATLASLRLDVATPDRVEVGRAFDLAVAVRQLASPKLSEEDLSHVKSGFLSINWPRSLQAVRLRLELSAPECQIHGQESYSFRLYRGQDSPIFYFHLTPEKVGNVSIIVTVYQEQESLGSARVHTTAYEEVAGQVSVQIASQALKPDLQTLAQLRRKLAGHFNLDELRTLCFDLGIDYENFPATKEGMTREIIMYCQRYGLLSSLLDYGRRLRPEVTWEVS